MLCDKLAGVYTRQVREMNRAAEEHPDLLCGMMFNQRTNPLYIKAKEIVSSKQFGSLKRIVWIITNWYRPKAYYDQGGWRGTWWGEGGGVLLNQCPHQLDLFTWIAGLPKSVIATASTRGRDISVENDVTVQCKFENGATGVFITSTHDAPGTNRLEITGDGGKIVIEGGDDIEFVDPNLTNLVAKVSCKEVIRYGNSDKKVVLVDCGVKHNIIRCLLKRNVTVIRVPWDYDFNTLEYDGLFISNGPGDPDMCGITVDHIRQAMNGTKPIFGICMGNQLLSKAGGARTYKLKYGHRSHNQPVRQVGTNRCFITSQNHGFAVDNSTLGADW